MDSESDQATTELYTVRNPRTRQEQQFKDPKEAGAAFFNEERSDRPMVSHSQDDPNAPGGRFGRFMADTEVHSTYANGEPKYVKTLPNSHKGDAEFRAGYMAALETSVNERLQQVDWDKTRPHQQLDNRLLDDLDTLARVDNDKAIKAWKAYAPEGASPPTWEAAQEPAAKQARDDELLVRSRPTSTDEEKSLAKEARKAAELRATGFVEDKPAAEQPKGGRRDFRQEATQLVVEMLEKGAAPWQRPWDTSKAAGTASLPYNGATGRPYSGGNAMYLMAKGMSQGYDDPRWLTYEQANSKGWQVRKGEKATHVEFWQFDKAEKERGEDGQTREKRVKLERPIQRLYAVFNASQIDGMPPLAPTRPREAWEANAAAERALKNSGAEIVHGGPRAFYQPGYDRITMPPKSSFKDDAGYYGTALHELVHWTGHESRLNRDGITKGHPFGSEGYAKEELRAEMGSVFLQADLGVNHDLANHAGYVQSWIKVLKEDKNELFRAAKDAGQAADYVIELSKHRELDKNVEQELLAEAQGNVKARYGGLETAIVGTGQGERLMSAALHRELERVAEAGLANPADIDRFMSNSPYGQAPNTEAAQELDTALHELDYISNLPLHVAIARNHAEDKRVVELRDLQGVAYVDGHTGDLTIAAKSPEALKDLLARTGGEPDGPVLGGVTNTLVFASPAHATEALKKLGVHDRTVESVAALANDPADRKQAMSDSFGEISTIAKQQLGDKAKTYPAQLGEGNYSGPVIAESEQHLLQRVSGQSTVAHMKSAFQGQHPEVDPDKPMRITYDDGRANARPALAKPKQREQQQALSR